MSNNWTMLELLRFNIMDRMKNRKHKVGEYIICPVCWRKFKKTNRGQWSCGSLNNNECKGIYWGYESIFRKTHLFVEE